MGIIKRKEIVEVKLAKLKKDVAEEIKEYEEKTKEANKIVKGAGKDFERKGG